MRVAINCRSFLNRQYTGIGRYAYHLVKSLSAIDHDNEYHLYARKGFFSFNKRLPNFHAKNFIPRIDRFNHGPARVLKDIDIMHFPSPRPLEAPLDAKIVVTVHDVIFKAYPDGHTQQTIDAGEKQFADIGKKAAKIICCSKSTVDDLQKYFKIPTEKIALVYQGVDKSIFRKVEQSEMQAVDKLLSEKQIDAPFVLSVGTIEPRKNLKNLIRAFFALKKKKRFSGKLVVVGMKGWMNDDISALIEELGLKEHIIWLGYVTDQELCYLYNAAEVFAFPSFYEGFGFPIVEAFSCGAPVVTSDRSSCPEVAGEAAITVDPNSPDDIAEALHEVITDRSLKESLRKKGFQRAEDFDLKKTAFETLEVYKEVYKV